MHTGTVGRKKSKSDPSNSRNSLARGFLHRHSCPRSGLVLGVVVGHVACDCTPGARVLVRTSGSLALPQCQPRAFACLKLAKCGVHGTQARA